MKKLTLKDVSVERKRVLVRVDYNVPLDGGVVADDARIRASLPTIRYLLGKKAKIILLSHLGRPAGEVVDEWRMDPVARCLEKLLGMKVKKIDFTVGPEVERSVRNLDGGEILLLENVRFLPGEEKNDPLLAEKIAALADIFVNDAFGTAHRAHVSTTGITRYLPAVAGFLMEKEITTLRRCLDRPERPLTAIFGGAKVSDKIGVINKFLELADNILIGGGMANTFLRAKGYDMASSFYEEGRIESARELLKKIRAGRKRVYLPDDLVIVEELVAGAPFRTVAADSVTGGWKAVDIGPGTMESFSEIVAASGMIIWNGPLGVFELSPFDRGTEAVARAAVESKAYLLVGGGDTAAAFERFGIAAEADYISTGGGATLEFLEGKELPGIAALKGLDKY
ncbi:MAG: phosphoglycerate kinase [Firmicutes bacterium]|nr:phosphoglycerate kinase [Bacillota bacterium]